MKTLYAAAALALGAAPGLAQAETAPLPTAYGSLGYAHTDGGNLTFGTLQARIGLRVHKFLGAEIEGSMGAQDDDLAVPTALGVQTVNFELKRQYGGYAVAFLPLGDRFELHARVGYSHTRYKGSYRGIDLGVGHESVNYGVGAKFSFDQANAVRADFTREEFTDGDASNVYAIAFERVF